MTAFLRQSVLAAVLGTGLAGCGDPISTATVPTGVLSLFTRSESGTHVARPQAVFALAGTAPTGDSRSTVDTCQLGDFFPPGAIPGLEQLDAGDSIVFTAAADTRILRPANQFGIVVYLAEPAELDFVPGTAVSFSIPGAPAGFPAAEISSLTPPALTSLTPISTRPSLADTLTVTWEPAGDDSSRFEVLLLYATPGAADFDQQLVCDWRDDGTASIQPELLGGWAASEVQRIEVTRYRTQRQLIGDAVLFLLATFDTVPSVAP